MQEHGHHGHSPFEGAGDLESHGVVWIIDPPTALIVISRQPIFADEREHDLSRVERVHDRTEPVCSCWNALQIEEDILFTDFKTDQPEKETRVIGRAFSPIANEDHADRSVSHG